MTYTDASRKAEAKDFNAETRRERESFREEEMNMPQKAFVGMTQPEKKAPSAFNLILDELVAHQKQIIELNDKRTELLKPFADREEEIQAMISAVKMEQDLLIKDQEKVTAEIDREFAPIETVLEEDRIALADLWTDQAKTQEVDGFRIARRDLKRLEIVNKEYLINQLIKCNKIHETVKTFDKKLLMQLADLNFLDVTAVRSEIFKSITAKKIEKLADIV